MRQHDAMGDASEGRGPRWPRGRRGLARGMGVGLYLGISVMEVAAAGVWLGKSPARCSGIAPVTARRRRGPGRRGEDGGEVSEVR